MQTLEKGAMIDERFRARFPDRRAWLRPATGGERRLWASHASRGWHLCVVVVRDDGDYRKVPFLSRSRDLADATETAVLETATAAIQAINAGAIARIVPKRFGRA
ncbi:hypothetical protein GL279_14255 [Paracoccus limosus]|uniref:Uncharacterized protein n=1 Tax=Paracoccus limosus TaxID=913252 RepID=A0A844H6W7_9RHOB|nr:hypothetical protein [Paracoccus limosus]MTH35765.1 hypothetical protein [Paracoccus limosus]